MRKLILKPELKKDLYKLRKILEDVTIEKSEFSNVKGGACGGICYSSCSYYCETICEGSCRGVSEMGCAYKAVCPGQPYIYEGP